MDPVRRPWSTGLMGDEVHDLGTVSMDLGQTSMEASLCHGGLYKTQGYGVAISIGYR